MTVKRCRPFALILLAVLGSLFHDAAAAAGVQPGKWVYPSYLGDLLYGSDPNGVRINDFSECGYQRGEAALPDLAAMVPTNEWIHLRPLGGGQDDSAAINAALDSVGARPTNALGFRGVVYLEAGVFRVADTIVIANSGVVLKGAGSSLTTGTRLLVPTVRNTDVISVSGIDPDISSDPVAELTEYFVPAGTRTFRVSHVGTLQVGQTLSIHHELTWSWVHALEMDRLAATWISGWDSGHYERQITRIEGNWITVDSPVPQSFEQQYGAGTIFLVSNDLRVRNCGVEDLACIFSVNPGDDNNAYPPSAVNISDGVNIWVRNVIASGYLGACVTAQRYSRFITVAESEMLNYGDSDFHDRYAFRLRADAANVLVRDCYATYSRHSFVTEATVPGPNAFVRGIADQSQDETGPHQRWSTGVLLDRIRAIDGGGLFNRSSGQICIQDRGNSGGGGSTHGWTGAYSVVWNCNADEGYRVRSPPTALNWLIGSPGTNKPSLHGCAPFGFGDCWSVSSVDPEAVLDQSGLFGKHVQFHSLYYAQLQQRLKAPASQFREYRLGTIDQFGNSGYWDEQPVPVDPYWFEIVRGISGVTDGVTNRFDTLRTNRYTAFSFIFPVATDEQIVAGSITLGLRLVPGSVPGAQRLYLGNSDAFDSFGVLGWNVTSNATSVHTALIVPAELQNGLLNVAIGPDCGVDFAELHLQVAPVIPASTTNLNPLDTYVVGGGGAVSNFSAESSLYVKNDDDAQFERRAFLHWNLSGVSGGLVDAKVRFFCNDSGQPGNEQSASLVLQRGWSPTNVTWNTQPATKPPLAYWVPEPGAFTEFAVTPEVRAALVGDKQLMIAVQGAEDFGNNGLVSYASSEDANSAHRPQLILRFTNSPPAIVGPPAQLGFSGMLLGPLPITIGDAETPANNLTLIAQSLDPGVIPDPNIMLGGSGSNRQVFVQIPIGNAGQAPIRLTVSDGAYSASATFTVNVNIPNGAPTISSITNQVTDEDTPLTVAFTVGDDGPLDLLTVAASTTNTTLFPPGNIQVTGGTGPSRSCVFTPAPDRFGTSVVSIVVSDSSLSVTQKFTLAVRSVEDPPTSVLMQTPRSGERLVPDVPALLRASAFDAETNIVRFDYYRQDPINGAAQLIVKATNAPFSATWTNPPAGDWNLYAVATDQTGLSATSPSVTISVSVPEVIPPELAIGQVSNSVVVLWPESAGSNALWTATSLVPPVSWTPAPAPSLLDEGAWIYQESPKDPQRYFRLVVAP